MAFADGKANHHDIKKPHWRCEVWIGGGVCGMTETYAGLSNEEIDWIEKMVHSTNEEWNPIYNDTIRGTVDQLIASLRVSRSRETQQPTTKNTGV